MPSLACLLGLGIALAAGDLAEAAGGGGLYRVWRAGLSAMGPGLGRPSA